MLGFRHSHGAGIRTRLCPASGPPACCRAPPVTRSPMSIGKKPAASKSSSDRALCFRVVAGDEQHPPATDFAWVRTQDVGRERVGRLHDPSAGNQLGHDLTRRQPTERHGLEAGKQHGVGRIDHNLARPRQLRQARRGRWPMEPRAPRSNSAPRPRVVPAVTPAPSASTTDVNDSGPRLFAITTGRSARRAVRANAWPSRPAPMMPIASSIRGGPGYRHRGRVGSIPSARRSCGR